MSDPTISALLALANCVESLVKVIEAQAPEIGILDTVEPFGYVVVDKDNEIRSGVRGSAVDGAVLLNSYESNRADAEWAPYRLAAVYEMGTVLPTVEAEAVDRG